MEPLSEIIEQNDGSQMSLLALLQILYEIEQCDKDRKSLNAKNSISGKGAKDGERRKVQKSRSKSPPKGKESGSRKRSPDIAKTKLKKTKAVKDLINAAKATHLTITKEVKLQTDENMDVEDEESSIEELLEDLCFLLLTDSQIVRN